jgi:hypothetical protein
MPGPNPSDHRLGFDAPPFTDAHPSAPIYPGPVPPSLPYPTRRRPRRRLMVSLLAALLAVAALAVAILHASHQAPVTVVGPFSEATASSAIQRYLDALEHRDVDVIARNSLCGIYDAVRDRRSDQAVAKLSSDAFRKQFSEAKVTSIDKIVYWSEYQAQVLFTMRIQPATGSSTRSEVQATAQLFSQHNQILVCSYVLHTGGEY